MYRKRTAYWQLVEELMRFGWYRERPAQRVDLRDGEWSFRNGHTIDDGAKQRRLILAPSELDAMRLFLEDLQRGRTAQRPGQTGTASSWSGVAVGPE